MNIYLTVRDSLIATHRYRQAIQEIRYLLERDPDARKRRNIRALAESVLFPDSFLLKFPVSLLVALITELFDFLERREGEVAIRHEPLESGGGGLLLIHCPNAPHIVDSILALQQRLNGSFQVVAHPLLTIKRQGKKIVHLDDAGQAGPKELFAILRLEEADEEAKANIEAEVARILQAALSVHRDSPRMTERLLHLEQDPALAEQSAFLAWLREAAFIPFLYRGWRSVKTSENDAAPTEGREFLTFGLRPEHCYQGTGGQADERLLQAYLKERVENRQTGSITIQGTPLFSPLLRHESMICVAVREGIEPGDLRVHAFLGLFSKSEMAAAADKVPALSRKLRQLLEDLHLSADGHDYRKLKELFNLFPKVELFFTGKMQLQLIANSLIHYLHRSDTLKLLILASPNPSAVASLILIPRRLYREGLADEIESVLCRWFPLSIEKSSLIDTGESHLGLHLLLHAEEEEISIEIKPLERAITRLAQPWELKVRRLLERALGNERGAALWRKYSKGFGPEYRSLMPPRYALRDVLGLERLTACKEEVIELLNPCREIADFRLHFYGREETFLDQYMPVLENLNLRVIDQVQFTVTLNREKLYIKSFSVKAAGAACAPLSVLRERLLDALFAIFRGQVENDPLNGLLVLTGLAWKEIDVLRAYRNYYFQLGSPFTQSSFHRALLCNPKAVHLLFRYFEARFRPLPDWTESRQREEAALFPLRLELLDCLESVKDINEDRILRTLFNLIDATVRCNFHVRWNLEEYFIAFKIDSLGVIEMPAPRPKYEIYVHAAHMEGIHLRGGEVARGGIRWSDRVDDFRTEILDLMQTQMSKNALIVPKGAKGGFVLKKMPESKEAAAAAAKEAYITLIRGLLDLTDNRAGNDVVQLPGIIAYDGQDPYLVVAADKGTADFSDVANAVAEEYRFWLKDAFASGGSQGYNHKVLGITARGAWECVKRHFREIGRDIQKEPFTVIGIGSMDGDVFGNGMLLSRRIRLLAAFSGQHIFLDPDSDPEISFAERQRLFELPGSSWDDYDRELISEGGGVYPRNAKDIPLSPQARQWFGVRHHSLDGDGLIRQILKAPADFLWLGGIGTYVKASTEKNEEVGDRVNDNVRVDAQEIRARVVGEGANLGFTQKGRIEYNLAGRRINTDGVDNSAGVDTSDHEVNLKILMIDLQKKKLITDYHPLFERLTEEVCRAVIADNYAQSLCLSLDSERCRENPERFLNLADALENSGLLDRASESFPRRKELLARPGQRLSRPELAILMAYGKMQLFQELMERPAFLAEPFCRKFLRDYFPEEICRHYGGHLDSHPLADEIKATVITNKIIGQAGSAFLAWFPEEEAFDTVDRVSAYITFDRVMAADDLRNKTYALDNLAPAERQYAMLLALENRLESLCRWAMGRGLHLSPSLETLECYCEYLPQYESYLEEAQQDEELRAFQESMAQHQQEGFSKVEARRMALLSHLEDFPRMVTLVSEAGGDFMHLVRAFDGILVYFGLKQLQAMLDDIPARDHWDRKVKTDLIERIKSAVSAMTVAILPVAGADVAGYFEQRLPAEALAGYRRLRREIGDAPPVGLLPYTVLCGELEKVTETVRRSVF